MADDVLLGSIVGLPKSACITEGLCFLANYNVIDSFNATWGKGSLLGTPYNSCANANSYLDLGSGTPPSPGGYVDYSAINGNADTATQQGCIRFDYIPMCYLPQDFSFKLFGLLFSDNNRKNNIELIIESSLSNATIRLIMYGANGQEIYNDVLGEWVQPSLEKHEFELNWDLDIGETRLFIDGQQFGSTVTSTGNRNSSVNIIRVGNGYDPNNFNSIFGIDDFMIFDLVQHTENYITDELTDNMVLPTTFSDYVICDGTPVDNPASIYNGIVSPNMSVINSDIIWLWKIL